MPTLNHQIWDFKDPHKYLQTSDAITSIDNNFLASFWIEF